MARPHVEVDPGPEFTARVMARRELRWSHRRKAGDVVVSRQRRRIGVGLIAAMVIAGIVLAWRWPWPAQRNDAQLAATGQAIAMPAGPAPPATAQSIAPAAQSRADAAPATTRDLYRRYTVVAMPLRQASVDAEGRMAVESFNAALLDELRRVPGLVLLVPGVTAPPPDMDRPADFLLTVAGLADSSAAGGAGFRFSEAAGGGMFSPLSGSLPAGVVTLSGVDTHTGTGTARQWPVEIRVQPIGLSGAASFTSAFQVGAETAEQLAARQASMLRVRVFPDALVKQQLVARMRDGSLTDAERSRALSDLLATQLRGSGQGLDAANIGAIIEQAALLDAGQRAQLWRSLRGIANPELVEPLLDYLRRDADPQVRFEALATLAASFAGVPRVHAGIEAAADDADPLVRMAARRVLDGDEAWHRDIVAALADRQLDYDARLAPLLAAARSASTADELRALRTLVAAPDVMDPLAGMVREGWFDAAQAGTVADALELLASAENPPAFDLSVQLLPDTRAAPAVVAMPAAPPAVVPQGPARSERIRRAEQMRRGPQRQR